MKKVLLKAFSLVELMVTLVVVAILTAAMAPIITKRLKSKEITVSGGGGNSKVTFQECSNEMKNKGCVFCSDENTCSLCTIACSTNQYVVTESCECAPCTDRGEKCIQCNSKNCVRCEAGYGLSSNQCIKCETGQYSNGEVACATCPENHKCSGNSTTPVACATDEWAETGSDSCSPCTDILANCAKCNPRECLECKKGYKLKDDNGTLSCFLASDSRIFTTAGEHSFKVPEGIEELTVTLVSGGAGGGGGKITEVNKEFKTSGTHTWTIPTEIKGKTITFSSVGGGGGAGKGFGGTTDGKSWSNSGGKGGSIKNKSFTIPNQTSLKIIVGAKGNSATLGNWAENDVTGYTCTQDPLWWCWGACGGWAGRPTYIQGYNNSSYTAGGGGGGTGSNTVVTASGEPASGTNAGSAGGNGKPSQGNVFTSNGNSGQAGALKFTWTNKTSGTGGGAGHIVPKQKISVVSGETLKVIVGAGGAGGAVGAKGVGASATMISKIVDSSGITLLSSAPSVSTMGATGGNYDGTTVGTAGWINIGTSATTTTMDGFSNTNGGAISGDAGGAGGTTTIEGLQTLCSAGVGGSGIDVAGSSATGFGGCGGGGGGAGANGGDGACGYVKISWGEE